MQRRSSSTTTPGGIDGATDRAPESRSRSSTSPSADGELINGRLDAGPGAADLGRRSSACRTRPAGLLSSSRPSGLAADLSLKPDIAAPGGLIRSTWPGREGRHRGAERHVDGLAARRRRRRAVPAGAPAHAGRRRRRGACQNSADPVPWSRAGTGLEPVARQGAGLLDVDDAILATTTITPGKLSLRGQRRPRRRAPDAHDRQRRAAPGHLRAVERRRARRRRARRLPRSRPSRARRRSRSTQRGRRATSLTVRPREHVSVDVRIAPGPGAARRARSTAATSSSRPTIGGAAAARPYAGYKGDYQAVPAMTPTAQGFPWLARKTGIALDAEFHVRPVYERAAAGASFTFAPRTFTMIPPLLPLTRPGADLPLVLVHLENPAQRVRIEAFSARRGRRSRGRRSPPTRLPRNAVRRPWRRAVGAGHRAAAGRHRPSRSPARAAARRRVLRAGDRRAGLRRTPDTGRDLVVTDLPDRPSLDNTLMLALGAAERELELTA